MSVLLLRLAGPLQAWGDSSRFTRRETRREPTKSGIVGLLAAALGRSREAGLADLAALELAVRVDQPGTLLRDFQTERPRQGAPMPLTHRYYLADAKFLAALGGQEEFLDQIDRALKNPCWPLYLGRRSCPPDQPISLGVRSEYADVRDAVLHEPWLAAPWYQEGRRGAPDAEELEVVWDAREGENPEYWRDSPVSFAAAGRVYIDRPVVRRRVPNPSRPRREHDPMACL